MLSNKKQALKTVNNDSCLQFDLLINSKLT